MKGEENKQIIMILGNKCFGEIRDNCEGYRAHVEL